MANSDFQAIGELSWGVGMRFSQTGQRREMLIDLSDSTEGIMWLNYTTKLIYLWLRYIFTLYELIYRRGFCLQRYFRDIEPLYGWPHGPELTCSVLRGIGIWIPHLRAHNRGASFGESLLCSESGELSSLPWIPIAYSQFLLMHQKNKAQRL